MMRVRFPLPAPRCADIAQLVERTLGKGEVGSSNLPISSKSPRELWFSRAFYCNFIWTEFLTAHSEEKMNDSYLAKDSVADGVGGDLTSCKRGKVLKEEKRILVSGTSVI